MILEFQTQDEEIQGKAHCRQLGKTELGDIYTVGGTKISGQVLDAEEIILPMSH